MKEDNFFSDHEDDGVAVVNVYLQPSVECPGAVSDADSDVSDNEAVRLQPYKIHCELTSAASAIDFAISEAARAIAMCGGGVPCGWSFRGSNAQLP